MINEDAVVDPQRLVNANFAVSGFLGLLDIDVDGVADGAPDTDGISDFIDVFGLMFIDEDRSGLLDLSEWVDKNFVEGSPAGQPDGLPSPGEYPVDNSVQQSSTIPPDNPDLRKRYHQRHRIV